jgi:hypothetical protein
LNGIQEVRGSTPLGSTKLINNFNKFMVRYFLSSSIEKVIKSYKDWQLKLRVSWEYLLGKRMQGEWYVQLLIRSSRMQTISLPS